MIKVKDEKGLVRDPHSKAILHTDTSALNEHRRHKNLMKQLHNKVDTIDALSQDVNDLKKSLDNLTHLITQMLNKKQ